MLYSLPDMALLPSSARVCVIGAGAAGLCAARHLLESFNGGQVVVYEQTDNVGGTWVYTPEVGTCTKTGLPIHSR